MVAATSGRKEVRRSRKEFTEVEELSNLAQLAADVDSLSRAPFKKMLGLMLGVTPTKASLQRFANKSPDRWAQALSVLGVLAGYERGAEVNLNFYSVKGLSDAELLREAAQRGVRVIEGEALHVQESLTNNGKSKMLAGDGPSVGGVGDTLSLAGELTPLRSGPTVAAEAAATSAPQTLSNPAPLHE
jgi:hypothetical protein